MTVTVGVLSDTHLPGHGRQLPRQLFEAFEGVSAILHAGDLNALWVLDPLRALAPVHAVVGNTDPWEVFNHLPQRTELELGGVRIGLAHGHDGHGASTVERARSWFPEAAVVVYGHSHLPRIGQVDGQLLVNPGSPTDRRRCPTFSCAILTLADGVAEARLVEWAP